MVVSSRMENDSEGLNIIIKALNNVKGFYYSSDGQILVDKEISPHKFIGVSVPNCECGYSSHSFECPKAEKCSHCNTRIDLEPIVHYLDCPNKM